MASASLFRSSKTRGSKSQAQMKSQSLSNKQQYEPLYSDRSVYLNPYNIPLPSPSVMLLENVVRELTGKMSAVNVENRDVHVVGLWIKGLNSMVRCCFVQPEVTSALFSVPLINRTRCEMARSVVCGSIPGVIPCTITSTTRVTQVSGRLAPYVLNEIDVVASWTFANIAKSKILFVCTDNNGSHILTLSTTSMQILKEHMPQGSVCVQDARASGYKITASPRGNGDMRAPNKNTCMVVYGDGAFKFQGMPSDMGRVASSFRRALLSVMSSTQCSVFMTSLLMLPLPKWDQRS